MDFLYSYIALAEIYVLLGLSTNLPVGVAGIFSVSQAAVFGVGAYVVAFFLMHDIMGFVPALMIAAACCVALNVLVTPPSRGGDVQFDGKSIQRLDVADRVALGLRLLPEGRGIFPDLSVEENVDVVAARNVDAGAMFDIPAVYKLFPVLRERRTTRAGSMSGGQQQMLGMSLAILGSPRCLLLDEPSIWLAPNLVERMFEQVRDVCKSHAMTAVLVEQNVAAAMKIADRVIIMNNGQVVFDGLPDEARASNVWHYF